MQKQPESFPATGTLKGVENKRFPTVEKVGLNSAKRTITVFGFTHGADGEFRRHSRSTKAAIDSSVKRFKPHDYILVEGYEDELGRKALKEKSPGKVFKKPHDPLEIALLRGQSRLQFCERFEWYDMFPWTEDEVKLIESMQREKTEEGLGDFAAWIRGSHLDEEEQKRQIRRYFDTTWIDKDMVAGIMQHDTKLLMEVSGLPEESARKYCEKRMTMRSLLAARTALWRSELMDVKLFMGCLHSAEIIEFLTDQRAMDEYVDRLHPDHRYFYERNEGFQESITTMFIGCKEAALRPGFLPLLLRWIAYKAYETEYERDPSGRLAFEDYRGMLIRIMRKTGKAQPCICFSGKKFGKCCGPLLKDILAFDLTADY